MLDAVNGRPPIFIRSNLTLIFEHQPEIRRYFNAIEDVLKKTGRYTGPHFVPTVPEGLASSIGAQLPQVVYPHINNLGQIQIAERSVTFVSRVDDDTRTIYDVHELLSGEIDAIFDIVRVIKNAKPSFTGFGAEVRLPTLVSDNELTRRLAMRLFLDGDSEKYNEIAVKRTVVEGGTYYRILNISNYRAMEIEGVVNNIPKVPARTITERGIEIVLDYNDRYRFSERKTYFTNKVRGRAVLMNGFQVLRSAIEEWEGI